MTNLMMARWAGPGLGVGQCLDVCQFQLEARGIPFRCSYVVLPKDQLVDIEGSKGRE